MKKNRVKLIVVLTILIVFIISIGVITYFQDKEGRSYKEKGSILIEKVENHKRNYGELPNSVIDLEFDEGMGSGPFYEKIDSLRYIVYFSIGFDHSLTYYSDLGVWKEEP